MPYKDTNSEKSKIIICPHCGTETAPQKRCPSCGQILPRTTSKWKIPKMNAAEIFLAILGAIILLIGLVAV